MNSKQSERIKIANLEIPIGKEKSIDGEYVIIGVDRETDAKVYGAADGIIGGLDVSKKDMLRLKLLFEETIGMLKALSADFKADIWFEKEQKDCCIKIEAYAQMNAPLKQEQIFPSIK